MCTETVQAAVQVQALLSDFELACVCIHDGEVRNAIQALVNAQPKQLIKVVATGLSHGLR